MWAHIYTVQAVSNPYRSSFKINERSVLAFHLTKQLFRLSYYKSYSKYSFVQHLIYSLWLANTYFLHIIYFSLLKHGPQHNWRYRAKSFIQIVIRFSNSIKIIKLSYGNAYKSKNILTNMNNFYVSALLEHVFVYEAAISPQKVFIVVPI